MTPKKTATELRRLALVARPAAAERAFAEEVLFAPDEGLARLAGRTIAGWGGAAGFAVLKRWFETLLAGKEAGFVSADAWRRFKPGSYVATADDRAWLAALVARHEADKDRLAAVVWLVRALDEAGVLEGAPFLAFLRQVFTAGDQLRLARAFGVIAGVEALEHLVARVLKGEAKADAEKRLAQAAEQAKRQQHWAAHLPYTTTRVVRGHGGFTRMDLRKEAGGLYVMHDEYGAVTVRAVTRGGVTAYEATSCARKPATGVKADIARQNLEGGNAAVTTWEPVYAMPRFHYIDRAFRCGDCRQEAVFAAAEQKRWYEEYRLPTHIQMSRCLPCHRRLKGLQKLDEVIGELKERPDDPALLLEEAKYRIFNAAHLKAASLARAQRCLRLVAKARPELAELGYWQAAILENRGKNAEAAAAHHAFAAGGGEARLVKDARARAERLAPGPTS